MKWVLCRGQCGSSAHMHVIPSWVLGESQRFTLGDPMRSFVWSCSQGETGGGVMKCWWLLDQSGGWPRPGGNSRGAECGGPHISQHRPPIPTPAHKHTHPRLPLQIPFWAKRSCGCAGLGLTGCFINKKQRYSENDLWSLEGQGAAGWGLQRGMRGLPRLKSFTAVNYFLFDSLSSRWGRVREFVCIAVCACGAGHRPWECLDKVRSLRAWLPLHKLECIISSEKSRSFFLKKKNLFSLFHSSPSIPSDFIFYGPPWC